MVQPLKYHWEQNFPSQQKQINIFWVWQQLQLIFQTVSDTQVYTCFADCVYCMACKLSPVVLPDIVKHKHKQGQIFSQQQLDRKDIWSHDCQKQRKSQLPM